MARRMFSPHIVESDAFLEMPSSSQALYFHLGMYADDDGFVNPKKIMRMMSAGDDDLKVLITKRFVLPFENGVIVIKHWRINNLIRKDWYKPTQYAEQMKQLIIKENGAYTEVVNNSLTNRSRRLGKVRLGKVRIGNSEHSSKIIQVIDSFKEVNPSFEKWYGNTTQRGAIERLISIHGLDRLLEVVRILPMSNKMTYVPTITTPVQLEDKWASLEAALIKKKGEITKNNIIV